MPRKKKNYSVINRLFSTKVGVCNISMILDVRHSKGCGNSPLCLCFSINRKRVYHSLGERYSCEDLTRITNATGQGERKGLCETNFEKNCDYLTLSPIMYRWLRNLMSRVSYRLIESRRC